LQSAGHDIGCGPFCQKSALAMPSWPGCSLFDRESPLYTTHAVTNDNLGDIFYNHTKHPKPWCCSHNVGYGPLLKKPCSCNALLFLIW
jgi:hypothetical protein